VTSTEITLACIKQASLLMCLLTIFRITFSNSLPVVDRRLRGCLHHAIAKLFDLSWVGGPTSDMVKQKRNMAPGTAMVAWKPHEGMK
jgi:hypothetical protein